MSGNEDAAGRARGVDLNRWPDYFALAAYLAGSFSNDLTQSAQQKAYVLPW